MSNVNAWISFGGDLANIGVTLSEGYAKRAIAKHNATMARLDKYFINKRTSQKLELLHEEEARILGANRAEAGASGFAISSEATQAIEESVINSVAKDAAVIRQQGSLDILRANLEADKYKMEARQAAAETGVRVMTSLNIMSQSKAASTLFRKKKTK